MKVNKLLALSMRAVLMVQVHQAVLFCKIDAGAADMQRKPGSAAQYDRQAS